MRSDWELGFVIGLMIGSTIVFMLYCFISWSVNITRVPDGCTITKSPEGWRVKTTIDSKEKMFNSSTTMLQYLEANSNAK